MMTVPMHRAVIVASLCIATILLLYLPLGQVWEVTETSTPLQSPTHDLLLVSVWEGESIPDYFEPMLDRIGKNPSVSFLLIVSADDHELCPPDGSAPVTVAQKYDNIQISCIQTVKLHEMFSDAMCKTWDCTSIEAERTLGAVQNLLTNNYRMNDLKPVYQASFQQLWESLFPQKSFSHWIRLDLDVYLGNFQAYFPWDKIDYDVITFPPIRTDPRTTSIRGYFSAFRISDKMRDHWIRMSKFTTPAVFNSSITKMRSIDEGLQSTTLLEDPDISIYMEPGRVFSDTDTRLQYKMALHGDGPDIFVIDQKMEVSTESNAIAALETDHDRAEAFIPPELTFLRFVEMSNDCEPLWWIPEEDRYCVSKEETLQLESPDDRVAIIRPPGTTRLALYNVRMAQSRKYGKDVRPALGFHLLESKYPHAKPYSVTSDFFAGGYILAKGERVELLFNQSSTTYYSRYQRKDQAGVYQDFVPTT